MKAIRYDRYGGVDTLEYADMRAPEPRANDVVIEVHAASINPLDWKIRNGEMRSMFDLDLPHVPGRDVSGIIVAMGEAVTGFTVGDAVYGVGDTLRDGTHAEYAAVDTGTVARKPGNIDHIEAASLPICGISAIAGLENTGRLEAGEKVLIHAGAGGVGGIAVQLARHIGATVAATAGAANADYVRALGADVVVDYHANDFAAELSGYDLVFDTMGGDVHRRSFDVLKPGGRIAFLIAEPITGDAPRDDVTVERAAVTYETARLDRLAALVESGAIVPQVGEVVPLAEAARTYGLSETGHARGKIVLRVR